MSHVATVQEIYDAFGRGDVPVILDHLADDVAWDEDAPAYGVPFYEPGSGKEHARRFFEIVEEELEFVRFEPLNFLTGGDQVGVPIRIEARVNATGKTFQALEVHLWTFDGDGKVTRFFHCIDRHGVVLAYERG